MKNVCGRYSLILTSDFFNEMIKREKETIYLISGLGADKRVFQHLKLDDYDLVFIEWLAPLAKESMAAYAGRLSAQIQSEYPVIIGLSFGGMLAVEISKRIKVKALILISSAKSKADLPRFYSFALKMGIAQLLPSFVIKRLNPLTAATMGVTSKSDKAVLASILHDSDTRFFRWALWAIAHWQQEDALNDLLEIHGTKDFVIPYRAVGEEHTIKGGGHLMILNRAQEVESIILAYLRNQKKIIQDA